MAVKTIGYDNKVALNTNPDIADINKVTDNDIFWLYMEQQQERINEKIESMVYIALYDSSKARNNI